MAAIEIPVFVDEDTYAWLQKYSDDQPRDDRGRWTAVPGAGTVKIQPTRERAFTGQPVPTKIRLTNKETDKITEAVAIQHLRKMGFKDAEVAATVRGYKGGNNYAVDVYADHEAIELKGGQVANGASAQQWRVKYGQEPKYMASLSDAKKQAMRADMAAKCLADKEKARKWLEKRTGHKCKAVTYTAIIDPDKRVVDLYRFNSYHLRLGWKSPITQSAYVRSYKY